MSVIQRGSLRDQVRDVLRDRIVGGALAPGSQIREPALAEELGVSRTPLREALLQLERDGMVRGEARRGFTVEPLSARDVEETFPIVASLHGLALRAAGAPEGELLKTLRLLNQQIRYERDAVEVFRLDRQWHGLLVCQCRNRRLVGLIEDFNDATRRYDLAYWREAGDARVSVSEHDGILDALEAGDVEGAAQRLEAHWMSGVPPLLRWLDGSRGDPEKERTDD